MFLNRSQVQNRNIIFCVVLSFLAFSCKKSADFEEEAIKPNAETNTLQTFTTNRSALTKDSIFLYAKQTYLWNEGMPSYDEFNPRQYQTNNDLIAAIRNLNTNRGKDKYSFVDEGAIASSLSGVGGDYGFSVFFDVENQLRVKFVYKNSPADLQGLKRGDVITSLNGSKRIDKTDVGISNIVDALFGDYNTLALTLAKPNQQNQIINVHRNTYAINPILYSGIYQVAEKKVGYIVFNSFTSNSVPLLDEAFAKFTLAGINELVVDLRYNGGGDVATADAFSNLIAPASQNGKVMYTTYWTKTMQDGLATILGDQKFYGSGSDGIRRLFSFFDYSYAPTVDAGNQELFVKRGGLNNLSRVYFMVSNSTASASELLINNLKPVMDVKLIGKRTFGKPVGFFALRIDKSDLYIPQFQTKNQLNQGDYFNGFAVDKDVADDVTKDFGDPAEQMLAQAFYHIQNGEFTAIKNTTSTSSTSTHTTQISSKFLNQFDSQFKGMVERNKLKFK